jgi:RHH-type proline utilization regulon transcriptional repressor/proline dehydrogenase/delta 1-pyrroline-5-carboxylate dehydrogenase
MDALTLGDPWDLATDVGPVIDAEAQAGIAPISRAGPRGACCTGCAARARAISSAPALIRVSGIADLEREVFGPVLHVATFKARGSTGDRARSTPPATA